MTLRRLTLLLAALALLAGCHAERTTFSDRTTRESIDVLTFRKADRIVYRGGPAPTLEADGLASDPAPAVEAVRELGRIAKP